MLSVRVNVEGGRPGSNRRLRGSQPRVLPSTPRPPRNGDDRARTGGLSLDRRVLCSSELRPQEGSEGGLGSPQPEAETLPFVRLRSQLLPIGAPAGACPRRHLLTGRPWRLLEASCTLGPRSAPALFRHFLGPSVDGPFLVDCAGGIRTHGLELMRLAGTAAPLPRYLAGWSRTSALRLPKPAGWPSSPTASCPSSRRPWNRTTLDRHIRAAPRRSACRRCLSAKRSDPRPTGGARP